MFGSNNQDQPSDDGAQDGSLPEPQMQHDQPVDQPPQEDLMAGGSSSLEEPYIQDDQSAQDQPVQHDNPDPDPASQHQADGDHGDLTGLKQAALEELGPLVDHLDQTPEERFKTTMMMIQATDDRSLVAKAHEAAKAIPDEKARAQALLDVVNEINYFTLDK